MSPLINLDTLTRLAVQRDSSLFAADLQANHAALTQAIAGASLLVIGGAGTIGAAFLKTALAYGPARVVVVDQNENGLTELVRDCRSSVRFEVPPVFLTYPLSFSDPVFPLLLREHGPFQIVANFAAHKHVRSEKDIFSIEAMLENNVFRARDLLMELRSARPEHFFCVSTDKASEPVNVMGASKKIMEDLIFSFGDSLPVTTARFANVAYSNGSLLQGFLERLARNQPLSAPSDVRRYFVTPEEAGEICLLACIVGKPGEILFPLLDPERDTRHFSEIAVELLDHLGLKARQYPTEQEAKAAAARRRPDDPDYPVYFFRSDTTGEKEVEQFHSPGDAVDFQRFLKLGVTRPEPAPQAPIQALIDAIRGYLRADQPTKQGVIQTMQAYLKTFDHVETGKNLDARM